MRASFKALAVAAAIALSVGGAQAASAKPAKTAKSAKPAKPAKATAVRASAGAARAGQPGMAFLVGGSQAFAILAQAGTGFGTYALSTTGAAPTVSPQ